MVFWGFTPGRKFGRFPNPETIRNIHVRKLILCCVSRAVKSRLFYFQEFLKKL